MKIVLKRPKHILDMSNDPINVGDWVAVHTTKVAFNGQVVGESVDSKGRYLLIKEWMGSRFRQYERCARGHHCKLRKPTRTAKKVVKKEAARSVARRRRLLTKRR